MEAEAVSNAKCSFTKMPAVIVFKYCYKYAGLVTYRLWFGMLYCSQIDEECAGITPLPRKKLWAWESSVFYYLCTQ